MNVIVSAAHRCLVVPTTSATVNLFPDALKLDGHLVLPHGVREGMLLRRIGVDVPNPMLAHYDFPGGEPYRVQKVTCALLTENTRAYVLNDMGSGKTRAALWAWDYLHGNNIAKKLLVVAPLSGLKFTWQREAFLTVPHRKSVVLHGSKAYRLEQLSDPEAEIFLINHDGLKVISDELENRDDIDTLVLDELAVYRNNSDRSKHMRKFADRFTWVWGMTGTPTPQEPTDCWAQAKIITPWRVSKYRAATRDLLMLKVAQNKYVPKSDAVENVYGILQPSVRFSLDDVVELPQLIERTIDVPLTEQQEKIYRAVATECVALIDQHVITAMNAGSAMNKLLQISSGWVYTENPKYAKLDNQPRVDLLVDLVRSAAHKVLVAVPYKHAIKELSDIFNSLKEPIEHAVVTGDTSQKERDRIFNLFQNSDKYKIIVCQPFSMKHSLTLTAADTIIWFGPIASLETYEQFNMRIRRIGQTHKQQFIHLQSTPVERKIYALLRGKKRVQDQLLDLLRQATEGKA